MERNKIRIAIIGLGSQAMGDHLPTLNDDSRYNIVGGVDPDRNRRIEFEKIYNSKAYANKELLLENLKPDAVFIILPHSEHYETMKYFAEKGIHIIKEKPFTINLAEAEKIDEICKKNNTRVLLTLQRRFNPIYKTAKDFLNQIGEIYFYDHNYTLNIDRLDEGWRAKKAIAGGGALIDMGYHSLDLVEWFIGIPTEIFSRSSYGNRPDQDYDVEDTILLSTLHKKKASRSIVGSILISRVGKCKTESFKIWGTKGHIELKSNEVKLFDENNTQLSCLSFDGEKKFVLKNILSEFNSIVCDIDYKQERNYQIDLMRMINASYSSASNNKSTRVVNI